MSSKAETVRVLQLYLGELKLAGYRTRHEYINITGPYAYWMGRIDGVGDDSWLHLYVMSDGAICPNLGNMSLPDWWKRGTRHDPYEAIELINRWLRESDG